jgi:hypothetical protein
MPDPLRIEDHGNERNQQADPAKQSDRSKFRVG